MSTPGEVTRLCYTAQSAALRLLLADRDLGELSPASAIPAINAGQRDLIAACCAVADAVRSIEPGELPREWRQPRERKAS